MTTNFLEHKELNNLLVVPNSVKGEISSDNCEDCVPGTTRSAFRVPIERQIKSERDSFESDCAVGSHKATNETQISSENLKENTVQSTDNSLIFHKDINFVSFKTEAQEDKLFPNSGNCFDDSQPDQDMADPFYEEFLDLNNLFPELIPGVDEEACHLLPEIPPELMLLKEEAPTVPIEVMADLDSILAETEVASANNSEEVNEVLNVEVVEEAPVAQDQSEGYPLVSSPGSAISLGSCSMSTTSDHIDVDLQKLLELLDKEPKETPTVDTREIFPEVSNVDAKEVTPETSTINTGKHKHLSVEEPAQKKAKPDPNAAKSPTDKATERRIKNNAASRVCRATRKQKEEELFNKEKELTKSNAALKAQVEELTKEAQTLKNILIQRLSGCSI